MKGWIVFLVVGALTTAIQAISSTRDSTRVRVMTFNIRYDNPDDGNEAGEFAPLFYRSDRFIVFDSGFFWLSETPEISRHHKGTAYPSDHLPVICDIVMW
ncbi:MAG: hypothetical protein HQ542_00590 [Bacteroidia bacterium]|nr:hypothetical protein [Bacteroidia bacterium]